MLVSRFVSIRMNITSSILRSSKIYPIPKCLAFLSQKGASLQLSISKFLEYVARVYEGKEDDKYKILKILEMRDVEHLIQDRLKITENIASLEELVNTDKQMKLLAEEELSSYTENLKELDERLLEAISQNLSGESYDNVIMEISAGVGGQEAMLFANELLSMYSNYLNYLGYSYHILDKDTTGHGGIRHASLSISGKEAYKKLRHEAGIHRVQRIPVTESSGRIHTSAVSIVILPQPTDIEISLNNKDLKIQTKRAQGAGGQSVNTTDSAVRIVHIPTGIAVESQTERSQIQNKENAMIKLRAKIYEIQLNEQVSTTQEMRRRQRGLKGRNERIRTYNFLQDRVTDHRIQGMTMYGLDDFLKGKEKLEELQEKLQKEFQNKILMETIDEIEEK